MKIHQVEREQDKKRVMLDAKIAVEEFQFDQTNRLSQKESYKKQFSEFMDEQNDYARKAQNSLSPLEYKLNKQRLENLGLSPQNKNLTVIQKY